MSEAKHTDGPWVQFADMGKCVAIMPAGRAGDICTFDQAPSDSDAALMTAAPDMLAALDRIFSFVSYVNIHGVGEQPEPREDGQPQPMRVPPEEFAGIFQEIGKLASSAIAKAVSQ